MSGIVSEWELGGGTAGSREWQAQAPAASERAGQEVVLPRLREGSMYRTEELHLPLFLGGLLYPRTYFKWWQHENMVQWKKQRTR